jgi:type 1 glutamine amidotransferase
MLSRSVGPAVKRLVLWSVPVAVLLAAVLVYLRARAAARGSEVCAGAPLLPDPDTLTVRPSSFRILVFTRHTGYTHRSIPATVAALHQLGAQHGFTVLATEDPRFFTDSVLRAFAAVVFLNTTGSILEGQQKTAFERYIRSGGGFVGIHGALDSESRWAWYHGLAGAAFLSHPPIQRARLIVSSADNSERSQPWERTDEWYDYHELPESVVVVVSVDETSYRGGKMGRMHPVTWYHAFEDGRAWYTAMGHTTCSYSEPRFLEHLLAGIRYAASAAR